MKRGRWIGWIVVVATAVGGAVWASGEHDGAEQVPAPEQAGVVGTVNGEPIFFEDLERRLSDMHSTAGAGERGGMDLERLMFMIVNDALLAQEARVLGMHEDASVRERLDGLAHRMAIGRLEREEVWGKVDVTEEEIREEFERSYRTVTFRMITAETAEDARSILEELEAGADFETVARERSIDQYSLKGGLLEGVARVDLPLELGDVAFGLEPGQTAGPIRTGLGWADIRVESVADADPSDLEAARAFLTGRIRFRQSEALRAALNDRLAESLEVTIHREALDAVGCERRPDGRLDAILPDPDAVVASLGERRITARTLASELGKSWRGMRNVEATLAAKPIVFSRLVRDLRIEAEAYRREYHETPEVKRAQRALETRLLVPRYLREVVGTDIEVTDDEIKRLYEERRDELLRPQRVHISQITVADAAEAERIAGLLRQGADLAWLAREHSIDRFRDKGGDRGWTVPTPGLDEFNDRLVGAEAGTVLDPIGEPGNYTVMMIDAVEDQGYYTVEEVSGTLRSAIYSAKYAEALHLFIQTLRERSEIEIDEAALSALDIRGAREDGREHGSAAAPPHGMQ